MAFVPLPVRRRLHRHSLGTQTASAARAEGRRVCCPVRCKPMSHWACLLAARYKRFRFPKLGVPFLQCSPLSVQKFLGSAESPHGNGAGGGVGRGEITGKDDLLAIAVAVGNIAALCL